MTRKALIEGLTIMKEQFEPERQMTDVFIRGYWMVLKDYPDSEFEKAVGRVMSQHVYNKMPTPGVIVLAMVGDVAAKAQIALNKIERAIPRVGNGHPDTVVFDDPYIHATIDMLGGWLTVCDIYWTKEWPFYRNDIMRTYQGLLSKGINELNVPLELLGYHDHQNMERGLKHRTKIIMIGDQEEIRSWRSSVRQLVSAQKKFLEEVEIRKEI